jgi:hypothetical protein
MNADSGHAINYSVFVAIDSQFLQLGEDIDCEFERVEGFRNPCVANGQIFVFLTKFFETRWQTSQYHNAVACG